VSRVRVAIIYATKSGTTRECAELLAKHLHRHDVSVFEVSKAPDLEDYDTVVLGFSVRMGRAIKSARKFMKEHGEILARKRASYFLCCGFIDCFDEYAKKTIPTELLASASDVCCFGGHLDPSRVKGFDKIIVKSVRAEILGGGDNGDQRDDMVLPTILDENISQFAERIKNCSK
jgi:menaquinone-dependent protoporphyrinogen oxidase